MLLVPRDELPSAPATLAGIEVHCQSPATVQYASLTIRCAPTAATALQHTFASNYAVTPVTVLAANGLTVGYTSTGWTPIVFPSPYVHDGASALLLDVQKVVQGPPWPDATMSSSSSPPRLDRPDMIYALGGPGSGAASASNAAVVAPALSFRLLWLGTPTIRNRADPGPTGWQYGLGSTVAVTTNGPPGHLFVLAAALDFLPAQVAIPGIGGALRLNGPVPYVTGLLDGAGDAAFAFGIPVNPVLVGFRLAHQGAVVDPATIAVTLTNGMDHFVNQ
jgi:hypothetical protein